MSALTTAQSPSGRSPRMLAAFAAALMLLGTTAMTPPALAQDQSTQQPAAQVLTAEQLDQLVAPIALYPDSLLGQILTASTYPLEDVMAARWSQSNPGVKGGQLESAMQQQNWDPSVKALTAVPQVLQMMNDKLDWTQELGEAYLAQPDDVAAAVQRLRLKAQAAGNLQTNSQQRVRYVPAPEPIIVDNVPQPNYVVIEPVDPAVFYVPVYNPVLVYGPWAYPAYPPFFWSPPGFVIGVGVIAFGAPFVVGPAIWATYDWRSHHVFMDVRRFNTFNHTNLSLAAATKPLVFDPTHRGNTPFKNAVLEQKFGKGNNTANLNTNFKNTLGNQGQKGGNGQNKITTLDKFNTGNPNNGTGGSKNGNNQIKTTNFEKLNGGSGNGSNGSNGGNGSKTLNTTIRTEEHHTEEHHVDLNKSNTINTTQTHIQQQNFVVHNNPPPPPHNVGGNPGGNQNNQKKKNP